mgnify:FL=1
MRENQDNLNFLDLVAKKEDEFIFSRLPTNQHRIYVGKLLKHIIRTDLNIPYGGGFA